MKQNIMYKPYPPYKPEKPNRNDYLGFGSILEKSIYYDVMPMEEADELLDRYFEESEEIADFSPSEPKIRMWEKLTLQDLLDLAPEGAKPSEIIIGCSDHSSHYGIELFATYIQRHLEKEESAYQNALKSYEFQMIKYYEDYKIYEDKLNQYEIWEKEQKRIKLQKELDNLK